MSEVKRYEMVEIGLSYHKRTEMEADEDGSWVSFEDYAALQRESESNLKSAQYSAETNRKVVRTNEVLSDKVAALQQKLDAVLAENVSLKRIIHPIANEHTSVECTDRPVWYVCDPRQMMSPNASQLCHMFHGPFWSRERATEFMENTSYRYGAKASVFCTSLYHYPEMRRLYDASKNLQTLATDAILNEVREKAELEGMVRGAGRVALEASRVYRDAPTRSEERSLHKRIGNFAHMIARRIRAEGATND